MVRSLRQQMRRCIGSFRPPIADLLGKQWLDESRKKTFRRKPRRKIYGTEWCFD